MEQLARTRDMTHAGLLALHALRSGPRAQRELAAASMVEEQTMSKVLDRLERAGYVTRERDPPTGAAWSYGARRPASEHTGAR